MGQDRAFPFENAQGLLTDPRFGILDALDLVGEIPGGLALRRLILCCLIEAQQQAVGKVQDRSHRWLRIDQCATEIGKLGSKSLRVHLRILLNPSLQELGSPYAQSCGAGGAVETNLIDIRMGHFDQIVRHDGLIRRRIPGSLGRLEGQGLEGWCLEGFVLIHIQHEHGRRSDLHLGRLLSALAVGMASFFDEGQELINPVVGGTYQKGVVTSFEEPSGAADEGAGEPLGCESVQQI